MNRPPRVLVLLVLLSYATIGLPARAVAWQHVLSGTLKDDDGDSANDVAVDGDGNPVAAGVLIQKGPNRIDEEFTVTKLAKATGLPLWRTRVASQRIFDRAFVLALNGAGDVFVGGDLDLDFAVAKLNGATGAEVWRKTISPFNGEAAAFAFDGAGNPVVVGSPGTSFVDRAFYVAKLDAATGAELWTKQFDNGVGLAVAVDGDGNVVAAGTLTADFQGLDVAKCTVFKLDGTDGDEIWRHEIAGEDTFPSSRCPALAVTSTGDAIVGGRLNAANARDQAFVARLAKANGDEVWRSLSAPAFFAFMQALRLDQNGDVVAVGARPVGDFLAAFAIKLAQATGATLWENLTAVNALFKDGEGSQGFDVAVDAAGNVGVAIQLDDKKGSSFAALKLDGATGTEILRRSVAKKQGRALAVAFAADGTLFAAGQQNRHWLVTNVTSTIAGRKLALQDDPAKPAKRKLQIQTADDAFVLGSPGGAADPSVVGATLRLKNPTSGETQTFALPAANWIPQGKPPGTKGYKYADKELAAGPCSSVALKPGGWQAKCSGDQISYTLDEASQGSIGATLTIGSESSCALFGGTVTKDIQAGAKAGVFQAKSAPAPASCP